MYPALINIKVFFTGEIGYNENLPFRTEPDDIDTGLWFTYIRPRTKHDYILHEYIRPLKPQEQ